MPLHKPTAVSHSQAGDGVELSVDQARSAERRGLIWILGLSLGAAIVALGLYGLSQFWLFR